MAAYRIRNLHGPDVRVYLVAADDVNDDAIVKTAAFVELGLLRIIAANQNYEQPETLDLASFRITMWCSASA